MKKTEENSVNLADRGIKSIKASVVEFSGANHRASCRPFSYS